MKLRLFYVILVLCMLPFAAIAQYNYGEALQKSLLFYETQQSGVLPDWNRISWRSNAGVNDGQDVGLDLTGGWHDAGDHVKFGFPMAFSVTALNWGFLEYKAGYDAVNQTEIFKRNIKWVTDYFIKCHPSPNEFYAQVADSKSQDHNFWMAPEMVDVHPQYGQRKSYKLSPTAPGTEVACETAAALASASIIFKDSDPAYSATLLQHAKELYEFGDTYRGLYNEDGGIPATGTYSSGGYQDELTWGALWLYKATGDVAYLQKAEAEYTQPDFLWSLVWDDKSYGNMVLLSIITGKSNYIADAERHLDFWQRGGGIDYSPGGQAHLTQWGSLRHAMNASLTALIYSDNVATTKKNQYYQFAVDQVNYALGDNPNNRSLVTGFGVNPPTKPHHRGQHASWTRSSAVPVESRHTLWGALMGGPMAANDVFVEDRDDFQANEVATDYNACYQGVLAKMIMDFGGTPLANFPQPETPGLEFINEVRINNDQNKSTEVAIWLNNRSAWPARVPNSLKARYFVDISEGVAAGLSASDYVVSGRGAGTIVPGLQAWDAANNIYYAEVEVSQDRMPFPGGQGEYRSEIQVRVALPNSASAAAWDPTNDFSYAGLNNTLKIVQNVPIYVDGQLVGGQEPNGGDTPTASFTATPETGVAPLEVQFNAAASSDPNGDAITYSWDFGNGTTSTLVNPKVTFTGVDSYVVSLTVSDGTNTSSPTTKTIVVSDGNIAPVADFTATPETGIAPVTVSFDASASSDENGDTLSYSWDFGDGTTGTGVIASHEYATVGEYTVKLTVSDGSKTGTKSSTINVTDGSPVAAFTSNVDTGVVPFDVTFDASSSINPKGGALTYSWTFGNGLSGSGVTTATTYDTPSQYTVTLTVANADGETDSVTKTIVATDGNTSCGFGTPTATALPTIHKQFNNIFVLGSGGPNLDNVSNFTINWDLANNGLYQFSMLTNNGVPSWWNDFKPKVTQNFSQANPEVTISNTGFAGLDGAYWATVDNGNFVLASKTGGFTIYFSETAQEPNCNTAAVASRNVSVANTCTFNTPVANALPSVQRQYNNIFVLGSGGPNLDNVSNFTINWDLANNGLYQFSMLTNNGIPSWWNDLKPKVTQNFNSAQPEVTITNSGFAGLDGSYWTTMDSDNFVLVSKAGSFTIYFSTTATEPNCGGGPGNTDPIADFSASPISGEAPLTVTFDASASSDADGDVLAYSWDFNDGNNGTGVTIQNTFTTKGNYSVVLTVDDGNGGTATKTVMIRVSDPIVIVDPDPTGNEYLDRFNELRAEFYAPENGYFSADGSPHHSIESLIVEAPDHGHESTSELYSYWLWLEVMNARVNGDWASISNVWEKIEQFIIPTQADQPTNAAYNPSSPAAYAPEFALPSGYPAPLEFSAPVGVDPVSAELSSAYGPEVYQMHWLLDNDNFYGYGNRGDGVSTPSYINTFQRGEQESVYETIPHPSWEGFDWGGTSGYLPLFTIDQNYSRQWRYTSATDADARAVQAMYWAQVYAKEQNVSLNLLDLDKATKMGDYLRLGMFDKYFKPLGVQSDTSGAGTGYDSAHYLMSWYISWGGAVDTSAPWAFRISSSHCHFGYQNPVAAYAMSQVNEMKPGTPNGARDWGVSLQRQLEFYTWLQSKEGGIAGGATNSWNGDYSTYPAGKSTFYDMAYDDNPVYEDPGSGTWFGWQAWSMERIAEYYYITNDPMAKNLMDKWANWVKNVVVLIGEDDFDIPATLEWTGEPDNWNPENPGTNEGLSVTVTDYGKDLGVAASMAKALIYYAAATEKYATLDTASRDLAKEVLDRMWRTYRDDKGVSAPESRGDFTRIFEQEVYVPNGFSGTMPNGDVIEPGVTFLDIRSNYRNDPDFARLEQAYNSGQEYTQRYHRSWAQIEVALANAEYGYFFGGATTSSKAKPKQISVGIGPNPASDFINISVFNNKDNVQLRLIDLSGRVITTKVLENQQQTTRMSVSGLPTGVYILETNDVSTNTVSRKKIIVK